MHKKTALLTLALALAAPVFAQASSETVQAKQALRAANQQLKEQNQATRDQLKTEKATLQAERQENVQDRCKNIQTRIDTQLNRYENNKQMFTTVFGNMQARLERLSARLATKNVDVTKLNKDIETLKGMIAKLQTDHDAFIANLKDSQASASTACGTSKGEFMNKLLGTRKVSLTVQQDRVAIRNFFQTTIRPDVLAIRKQLESQKASTSDSTNSSDTTSEKTL